MSRSSIDKDDTLAVQLDPALQDDPDAEFGGYEARKKLEAKLLRKLDARMCILIIIYILNYVRTALILQILFFSYHSSTDRSQ